MTALGNSRSLLPVDYPLCSLSSWSDAAVRYNYPTAGPSQLVYAGGSLTTAPHPYRCPSGRSLPFPDTSCSMYSSWRSPSFYYHQSDADWIFRQSKLDAEAAAFLGPHHRWKGTSDNGTTLSSTSSAPPASPAAQFTMAAGICPSTADAGLSPAAVVDVWSPAHQRSATQNAADQFRSCRQRQQSTSRDGLYRIDILFILYRTHTRWPREVSPCTE